MTVTDHPLLYFAEDREAAAVITMTHFIINQESALLIKHNAKVKAQAAQQCECALLASLYLQLHATAQSPQPQQHNVMSTSIITYTATDRYTDTVPGMEFCTLSQIVNIS